MTLPSGVLVEYVYDAASRLTEITYKQNGTTVLGNLTYEYDKNGNRTKIGGSFARTGIAQAVSSTAYNAANHQTTFGNSALTYDSNRNLQTITDPSGTTTYTWNARNQLVGISGPSVSASFVYDGLGRRQNKTINGNLTEFLYDGVNPVQETSGAAILANILPGLGVDEFLTRTDVVAGATSHFLTDALGSAIALTDPASGVQTEYTYEPFGRTTATGTSSTNPFQYTDRENDGTGLYYYRARFYHPELQRFISEDPIYSPVYTGSSCQRNLSPSVSQYLDVDRRLARLSLSGIISSTNAGTVNSQQIHLYEYGLNNPVNRVDPKGLRSAPQEAGCDYLRDLPSSLGGNVFKSPCVAQCCNVHDSCYTNAKGWCDMYSWISVKPFDECDTCNLTAVRCIVRAAASSIGGRKDCSG